jgi:serralysin
LGDETIVEDMLVAGRDKLDFSGTLTRQINLNMMILGVFQVVNDHLTLQLIGEGIEEIIGGSLADTIPGNGNSNTLRGGAGNDLLDGNNGDDVLDGGAGT